MSQHDLNIANQGFPAFRADLNNALEALGTLQSGATAPTVTFGNQLWLDTSADPSVLKLRNSDNDAWITLFSINQTTDVLQALTVAALTCTGDASFTGTGQIKLPEGTTAERSGSPADGMIRFNSDTNRYEGYANSAWGNLGGGATGGGSDEVFVENSNVITTNYTLTTNKNAMSVSPLTINSGVTVTVPSGQRWVVL